MSIYLDRYIKQLTNKSQEQIEEKRVDIESHKNLEHMGHIEIKSNGKGHTYHAFDHKGKKLGSYDSHSKAHSAVESNWAGEGKSQ